MAKDYNQNEQGSGVTDYNYQYGAEESGGGRSIRDYLLMIRERFFLLLACIIIIFVGSIIYTMYSTEMFRSVASLRLLRQLDQKGPIEQVSNSAILNEVDMNTQVQLLESGELIRRVNSRLKGDELVKFMAPYQDVIRLTGKLTPAEVLQSNRRVVPARMSLMVQIHYTHPDKEMAAIVANYFADEYISYALERRSSANSRAVQDLQVQVEDLRNKMEAARSALTDFKRSHSNVVSMDQNNDIDSQQLILVTQILTEDKRRFDEAQTLLQQLDSALQSGRPLWELPFIAQEPRVQQLSSQLADYNIQIASLSRRYREKHPRMIEAINGRQQTEDELSGTVRSASQRLRSNYESARKNYENSLERVSQKKEEIVQLDRLRADYQSMLADLEVKTQTYLTFNRRYNEVLTAVGDDSINIELVDMAFPANQPYKPRPVLNAAMGLFGGIVIGLGMVFLVSFIDDRVKTAFDIETALGLPLIGLIPKIKGKSGRDRAMVVTDAKNDPRSVEAFRAVYSTLQLSEDSKNSKVLLVTSTIPGEGKTFISSNLALTFASHGEKTVLVDCDLRMPNVANSLGLDNDHGVLSYFTKGDSIDSITRKEFAPNLDIITTGGKTKKPTQLLSSKKFEDFIHELRMRYDRVIIDTPPLAPVTDALNILSNVDGVVYTIRFNTVRRRVAKTNLRRLVESEVPVFGAILNNINSNLAGYYYSHYYDQSYDSYYLDEDAEYVEDEEERNAEKTARTS